jgi:hypothetical protein
MSITAQSPEDLRIDSIAYRKLDGTTLDGIRNPRLYADRDRDGEAEAGELLAAGAVDGAGGAVRFGAIPAPAGIVAAGESIDLILLVDLDAPASGEVSSALLIPHPPDPGGAGLVFLIAAALAVLLVEARSHGRLEPRSRPLRRAAGTLAALLFAAALLAPAGGCGGSGGGGGGAGAPVVERPREIQLGLLDADDLKLGGAATGVAASIEGLPEGGLRGPRYEIGN